MAKKNYRVASVEMLESIRAVLTDKEHIAAINELIEMVKDYATRTNIIVEIDAKLYSKLWKRYWQTGRRIK